jgi:hypothetical protein
VVRVLVCASFKDVSMFPEGVVGPSLIDGRDTYGQSPEKRGKRGRALSPLAAAERRNVLSETARIVNALRNQLPLTNQVVIFEGTAGSYSKRLNLG